MTVKVRLHQYFQDMAKGQTVVEAKGTNVREMIDDLESNYPGIREHLLDSRGRLQGFVELFVNTQVVYPESTAMPIKDGDEVEILMIVAGG